MMRSHPFSPLWTKRNQHRSTRGSGRPTLQLCRLQGRPLDRTSGGDVAARSLPTIPAAAARPLAEVRCPLAPNSHPDIPSTAKQRLQAAPPQVFVCGAQRMSCRLLGRLMAQHRTAPLGMAGSGRSELYIYGFLNLEAQPVARHQQSLLLRLDGGFFASWVRPLSLDGTLCHAEIRTRVELCFSRSLWRTTLSAQRPRWRPLTFVKGAGRTTGGGRVAVNE